MIGLFTRRGGLCYRVVNGPPDSGAERKEALNMNCSFCGDTRNVNSLIRCTQCEKHIAVCDGCEEVINRHATLSASFLVIQRMFLGVHGRHADLQVLGENTPSSPDECALTTGHAFRGGACLHCLQPLTESM